VKPKTNMKRSEEEEKEKSCCEKFQDSLKGLCTGEAYCAWNVLCCPFVLIYQFVRIYIWHCMQVIFYRFYDTVCCFCCRNYCDSWYYYVDKDFPATPASLASKADPTDFKTAFLSGKSKYEVDEKVDWVRPHGFLQEWIEKQKTSAAGGDGDTAEENNKNMKLFEKGIEPSDVIQGKLGDCWLLAALACMAEFPEAIQNVFITKEYNPQGKYKLRFWDTYHEKYEIITIDDRIPVQADTHAPLFAEPKGKELWVFLIEKAFAKYCWGYSNLSGGHTLWAFAVMTGDEVSRLEWDVDKNAWARYRLKNKKEFKNRPSPTTLNPSERYVLSADTDRFDDLKMWNIVKEYNKRKAVMSCGKSNRGEARDEDKGIVAGHAYSLIDTVEYENFKLMKLRNPWGEFEWKGDWGDNSDMWDKHPSAKKACKYENKDDGAFWIEFQDWKANYDVIQICDRTTKHDLHLDVREDDGCCGIVKGCCLGACEFWLCCAGFRTIYLGTRTSAEIVEPTYCCGLCKSEQGKAWKAESAYS